MDRVSCVSVHFTGEFLSAVTLWYKRAIKKRYKCRFATFTRFLVYSLMRIVLPLYYLIPALVTLNSHAL